MENSQLLEKIEDKELKKTVELIFERKIIEIKAEDLIHKEKSEIKEIILDKIKNFLEDNRTELETRIAELRRKGIDVEVLWIKSLQIPLKIKVFIATYSPEDLKNLIKRFGEIRSELDEFSK